MIQDQPEFVKMPVGLASAIVGYLSGKPFGEVEQLVVAMRSLQPIAQTEVGEKA